MVHRTTWRIIFLIFVELKKINFGGTLDLQLFINLRFLYFLKIFYVRSTYFCTARVISTINT